jgi:hypothetical protein
VLTLTGHCRGGKPRLFRLGYCASGGLPHQTACPLSNEFWLDVFSGGLNPEVLGSFWLKASEIWGGRTTSAEGPRDGEAGHARLQLYPGICLTTEEEHGKPQSG